MLGDEWCHEMKPTGLEIDSQGGAASRNILSQDENKMSSIASLPSFRVKSREYTHRKLHFRSALIYPC